MREREQAAQSGSPGSRSRSRWPGPHLVVQGPTAVGASGTAGASFRRADVRDTARPHATPPGNWTWNGDHTRLFAVAAKHVPRRAGVIVTCRKRGCRARAHVASAHAKRLLSSLAGQTYRAGDRLFITIRSPGQAAERMEVVMRSGRDPKARLL